MHDAGGVGLRQTLSRMMQVSQELFQIGLLAMNLRAQRDTINEFHGDEVNAFVLADFVNVRDVRMIQRGRRFCLASEAPHAVLIAGKFDRKYLQCYFTLKLRVLRQIHLTHAARANL